MSENETTYNEPETTYNEPEVPENAKELFRQPIQEKAALLFSGLLEMNYDKIWDVWHNSEGLKLNVGVTMQLGINSGSPELDMKLSYSEKHKDEASCIIKDPRQQDLNLDGETAAECNGKKKALPAPAVQIPAPGESEIEDGELNEAV